MRPSSSLDFDRPSMVGRYQPPRLADVLEEQRTALSNTRSLKHGLTELATRIQNGDTNIVDIEKVVLALQDHSDGLHDFVVKRISPSIHNEVKQPDSDIARKVFNIPEMLDMILSKLDIPDILKMTQVSHALKDAIGSSTKLQVQLGLRAGPEDAHLRALSYHLPGPPVSDGSFSCMIENDQFCHFRSSHSGSTIDFWQLVALFNVSSSEHLPNIGSAYRSMYIANPPIKQMSVTVSCCHPGRMYQLHTNHHNLPSVESEDGLTIGDLYNFTKNTMHEHRTCPNAPFYDLDEAGHVQLRVRFVAPVSLGASHPLVIRAKELEAKNKRKREEDEERDAKMRAYTNAKVQAHSNGASIPTLSEFEASGQGRDLQSGTYSQAQAGVPLPYSTLRNPVPNLLGLGPAMAATLGVANHPGPANANTTQQQTSAAASATLMQMANSQSLQPPQQVNASIQTHATASTADHDGEADVDRLDPLHGDGDESSSVNDSAE